MIVFTPVDLPIIQPDDWGIFWEIWKNARPLSKVKMNNKHSPNPVDTPYDVWIGLDIFKTEMTDKLDYQAPFHEIQLSLPNMYKLLTNIHPDIHTIRLCQSRMNIPAHTDNHQDQWHLRSFLHYTGNKQQWYFTKPFNMLGKRTYINIPSDTNWFMYHDKNCWHGTDYDPENTKILLQIFTLGHYDDLYKKSITKYHDYTINYEDL